jgi:G3E family GTPase
MTKNLVPITLLTGYLGAGKTTLINYVLNNQEGYKVAVIVNDIGEVNIDAELIAKGGNVTMEDDNLVPLSNGCICCTLKVDLINQVSELANSGKFDYILIEASGICEPIPIAQSLTLLDGSGEDMNLPEISRLDNVVAVVDALRLVNEFGCGDKLMHSEEIGEEDIENLVIQQIEFCNTIILNKVDEVTPTELKQVKEVIRALQPKAKIIETNYAKVDVKDIIDTHNFDFEEACASSGWMQLLEAEVEEEEHEHHHHDEEHEHHHDHDEEHEHHHHYDENGECECGHHHDDDDDDHDEHHHGHHHHCHHHHNHEEGEAEEYGIGTFVYYRRKPFDTKKLEQWIKAFPRNIIRAKGIVWLADDSRMSYVMEQAGRQVQVYECGRWYASAPLRQQKEFLKNPEVAKDWDEKVGDRMIKLVFIGQKLDKEAISKSLDELLVDYDG